MQLIFGRHTKLRGCESRRVHADDHVAIYELQPGDELIDESCQLRYRVEPDGAALIQTMNEEGGTMITNNGSKCPPYGHELILDLHGCDSGAFNRESIEEFFSLLCDKIEMTACELYFWDDIGLPPEECQTAPHTKGTSAVQFILTSSMVIHTLDLLDAVYLNIFSCKEFDPDAAASFAVEWFQATDYRSHHLERL